MTIKNSEQLTQKELNLDLPPLLVEWMRSFELEEIFSPVLRTVIIWAKRVSPPNASLEDLAIACMDLILWIFYLDDCMKEDYNIIFEKCSKILDGYQPTSSEAKLFHAYADILKRIAQRGYDMQHYLQERKKCLGYRVEIAKQRLHRSNNQKKLTYDEYFEIRQVTIAVLGWMTLWEILGDFYLSPSERAMPEVKRAGLALSAAYSFDNDLYSLVRDIEQKTPNLIVLHMEKYGKDIISSVQDIKELYKQEVNTFRHLSQSVLNASPSNQLQQYFQLLELNCDYITLPGLMENDNPERYNFNLDYVQQLISKGDKD
jgi:Terpene synthase family 2, C-terminal metal binding